MADDVSMSDHIFVHANKLVWIAPINHMTAHKKRQCVNVLVCFQQCKTKE